MKKLRVPVLILALTVLLQSFAVFGAEDERFELPVANTSGAEAKAPANPFVIQDESGINTRLYRDRTSRYIYSSMTHDPIAGALAALPKLPLAPTPSAEKKTAAFLRVDLGNNYKKHKYELRPGELKYDGTAYALTSKQYDSLKKAFDASLDNETPYPQWLVWMNPNRVTTMRFTDKTGKSYNVKSGNLRLAAVEQGYVWATSSKTETYDPKELNVKKLKGGLTTVMTFDNDITCTVVLHEKSLYVESSDMNFGCKYEMNNDIAFDNYRRTMRDASTGVLNPPTGKPVIYLYPEKTLDVSVKLDFKGKIHYTYPAYNSGWNVTASPDGKLINKADLSEHYYLFWDGDAYFNDWDFSGGFCVKGGEIESFFKDKLKKLGLTPREYNDFITYWTPILAPNKYNLITFSTTQYENVAALDITPAPDTVLRVHMVYKALEAPVDIPEQTLPQAPERKGFTVVEWGATRAR